MRGLLVLPSILMCAFLAWAAPCPCHPDHAERDTSPYGIFEPRAEPLRFVAENLYGRINGGAELFLEFGFEELVVTNHSDGEHSLSVDRFHMRDAAAALGIYLAKKGKEVPLDGPAGRDLTDVRHTGGAYQILAVRGRDYIQVNNFGGNEALLPAMAALAAAAVAGIEEAPVPPVMDLLPVDGRVPGSELLARGPFGLEPVVTLGEGDILRLGGEVLGAVARYRGEDPDDEFGRIVFAYPTPTDAADAFAHLKANLDSYLTVERTGDDELVYRDWQGEFGVVSVAGAVLRVRFGLAVAP